MSKIFRKFWGKKKQTPQTPPPQQNAPQTPQMSREDQVRAATILEKLRNLTVDAEGQQITLKGALAGRRAPIVKAVRENRFDDADKDVADLGADVETALGEKKAWTQKKSDYDDTKKKLDILTSATVPGADKLAAALDVIDTRVKGEDFTAAGKLLGGLKIKVNETANLCKESFDKAYEKFKLSLDDPDLILPDPATQKLKDDRKQIDTEHTAVLAERDKGEHSKAEKRLPALTEKITAFIRERKAFVAAGDKVEKDFLALTGRIQAIVGMDDDIPDARRLEKQAVVTLNSEIEKEKGDLNYAVAQQKLDDLKDNKLSGIEAFKLLHDVAKPKAQSAWNTLKGQAEEVFNYPQDKNPQSLKDLQKEVQDAYNKAKGDLDLRDYVQAETDLKDLDEAVKRGLPAKRNHDKEMLEYFAVVKTLVPRLTAAKQVTAPPNELTPLIAEFNKVLNELVDAQNKFTFKLANTKRGLLDSAITALLNARRVALLDALDKEKDPAKVAEGINKLAPEEIAVLGAKKQAAYLKKLRTHANGTKHTLTDAEKKARNLMYDGIPLDPEFVKEDRKKREAIINRFKTDVKFTNAKDNWATLSQEARKEFLIYAAKVQCEEMGHPEPQIAFVSRRKCKNSACADVDKEKDSSLLPPCPTCHGDKTGFSFGGCSGQGGQTTNPAVITLNTIPEAKFDDFGEQLDTIMHENAHAYQQYLIYEKMAKDPQQLAENDPLYDQAVLFYENELGTGYESSGETYNNQPLKRHSWAFGPSIRDGLLGPKAK